MQVTVRRLALDGAGRVRQFLSVTVPLIRPTLVFVVINFVIDVLYTLIDPRITVK